MSVRIKKFSLLIGLFAFAAVIIITIVDLKDHSVEMISNSIPDASLSSQTQQIILEESVQQVIQYTYRLLISNN